MKKKIATKEIILSAIVVLGLIILVYYWYQGSCWKNHSKAFNELGKPVVKSVLVFYKENQRYPNLQESEVIFKKAGCENLRQRKYKETKNSKGEIYERWANYYCDFKFRTYGYGITVGDLSVDSGAEAYGFGFSEGNTRCSASFTKKGSQMSRFGCFQDTCLFENLSH